jgi:hypothetical protein
MKVIIVNFIFLFLQIAIKLNLSTGFTYTKTPHVTRNENSPLASRTETWRYNNSQKTSNCFTTTKIRHGTNLISSSKTTGTILYESKSKTKGVYARPSAAIERGSGFFVPGLEGSRVRILFGLIVLFLSYLTTMNGMGNSNTDAVEFSQKLVLFYAVLLLFQGIIEGAKEAGLGLLVLDNVQQRQGEKTINNGKSGTKAYASKEVEQRVSDTLVREEPGYVEKIRWVAASLIALTPATHVLLLLWDDETGGAEEEEGTNTACKILYRLGEGMMQIDSDASILDKSIQSAIDTVYKSKGGRVSVPESHPCSALLPEEHRRCILLQKIEATDSRTGREKRQCLMIGSNQLLVAFTKNDLKWLGSLGNYLG